MLRITYQKADQRVVLRLEGRLAGPWVDELASFWAQTAPRLSSKKLSIDLRDLTYADFRSTDVLRTIYAQSHADLIADTPWTRHLAEVIKSGKQGPIEKRVADYGSDFKGLLDVPGKFFNKVPQETFNTLMWMASPMSCPTGEILFHEDDLQMESLYLILDGKVKLSINAQDGRKVTYTVAKKGDVLGLASALSGTPSEMTAEMIEPSKMARIWRQDFSHFLLNHPDAYKAVIKEVREDLLSAMKFLHFIRSEEPTNIEHALRNLGGTAVEASAAGS
ncbi:MAG: cyclic nucleotide-binding domain-containing protein [Terracidiphilus sp.]|jgi:hypothetical protein